MRQEKEHNSKQLSKLARFILQSICDACGEKTFDEILSEVEDAQVIPPMNESGFDEMNHASSFVDRLKEACESLEAQGFIRWNKQRGILSMTKKGREFLHKRHFSELPDIIAIVKQALENMDLDYCRLSCLIYDHLSKEKKIVDTLKEEKYLERPFAYEFYHTLRSMIDEGVVDLGPFKVQAEVKKNYQHIFRKGKMPDFIIHVPSTQQNLAVIEFKMASNLSNIKNDFNKFIEFKKSLDYQHLIEVIVAVNKDVNEIYNELKKHNYSSGTPITIIYFSIPRKKATSWQMKYRRS